VVAAETRLTIRTPPEATLIAAVVGVLAVLGVGRRCSAGGGEEGPRFRQRTVGRIEPRLDRVRQSVPVGWILSASRSARTAICG
jgi:hypothetical protein